LRGLVLAAVLAPLAAPAQLVNHLQPMAFLAGHCWKGTFPDGKQSDEHCFQWVYDKVALRDVHTVRVTDRPDRVGDTTYYWDSMARKIEYVYIEDSGGVMRGTVEPGDGMLVFPSAQYVAGGMAMTLRVHWTLHGADSYEAWSEVQNNGEWATLFTVMMKKVS
jgi:hypothetical protein